MEMHFCLSAYQQRTIKILQKFTLLTLCVQKKGISDQSIPLINTWGKIADILQTIFKNGFSWMKNGRKYI